ncbi:11726_t:CDS:1, partial [Paraglomus brasilianum]
GRQHHQKFPRSPRKNPKVPATSTVTPATTGHSSIMASTSSVRPATLTMPQPLTETAAAASAGTSWTVQTENMQIELPSALRASTPPSFRMNTPPPTTGVDPDTPKKGSKRMAKDQSRLDPNEIWNPSREEISQHVLGINLCVSCWQNGHKAKRCPDRKEAFGGYYTETVLKHPNFQPHLEEWIQFRKRTGKPWRLENHTVEALVVIPPYCFKCKT